MCKYNSRERVKAAISHKQPDRMPIDLGMHSSTGISAFAYYDLRKHLGLSTDNVEIIDMVQFTARVDEDILERFHIDCIALRPRWKQTVQWSPKEGYSFKVPAHLAPKPSPDGSFVVTHNNATMRMPQNSYFFDGAWLDVADRDNDSWLEDTAKEAERIHKDTPYFTCYRKFSGYFSESDIEWQCRLLTEPEEIAMEQEANLLRQLEQAGKVIDKMGGYIGSICLGSDLGSQRGPLIRPSVYDELCAPYLSRFCDFIHKNSDLKIFMHSCGAIREFIPTLIQCGVDILNPVQCSAVGMDAQALKDKYGDKLVFWGGGIDTQNTFMFKGESEVTKEAMERLSIFSKNGGYIFNPIHNIQANTPVDNIKAFFDAVR